MKVYFGILRTGDEFYNDKTHRSVAVSIIEKVSSIFVELPFLPTLDMEVNLESFATVFRFTQDEIDLLENCGLFKVKYLIINSGFLQVSIGLN